MYIYIYIYQGRPYYRQGPILYIIYGQGSYYGQGVHSLDRGPYYGQGYCLQGRKVKTCLVIYPIKS